MSESNPENTAGISISTLELTMDFEATTDRGDLPQTEQVRGLKEEATTKASSLIGQVKEKVSSTLSSKKDGIADRVEEVADAVHRSGEQFAGKQDWIAGAIERGASELTGLAGSLREADVSTLIGQIRSFARRQPGLFVGASLAAGFAIARVGKIIAADVPRETSPTRPEVAHGKF